MLSKNPYHPPPPSLPPISTKASWLNLLRVVCAYGMFCNLWYAGAIALYGLVYGDNSSEFGLYPIIPAALVACSLVSWIRHNQRLMLILAALTSPLAILFTCHLVGIGL